MEKIIGILKPTVEITISSLQEKLEKNNTLPDPNDPVEAEKSGMPLSIVSAFGESPSVTPSTSTPRKPTGLSALTLEYLAPSAIEFKILFNEKTGKKILLLYDKISEI